MKRGAAANARANSRTKPRKTSQFVQEDDGTSESDDDAALSYDGELRTQLNDEHLSLCARLESSDDPSSHAYNANVRSRSSHLASMDSSYNPSSGFFAGPSHIFATPLNITDDHSSPSELDYCPRLTTTTATARPSGFNPRRVNHPSLMDYA